MPDDSRRPFTRVLFETVNGRRVVSDEIRDVLEDKAGRVALGALMERVQRQEQLRRDTRSLGQGLVEARLTERSNEYRLYFAHVGTHAVLLGLLFHRTGGQGAQQRAIALARQRLAEWRTRDIR